MTSASLTYKIGAASSSSAALVLVLFRERLSHALEAALFWVVVGFAAGRSATPIASSCATSATG